MKKTGNCRTNILGMITILAVTAVFFMIIGGLSGVHTASAALSGGDVDTEAECRWCHCLQPSDSPLYMPNRHHSKVGQPIPGSASEYDCTTSCHKLEMNPATNTLEFRNFRDCIACHTSNPNPGHHGTTNYGCTQCHEMRWIPSPGLYNTVLMNWCGGTSRPAYDPPIAKAGADQKTLPGQSVQFDGSTSYDPEFGASLAYEWDFGDGTPHVWGKIQSHVYPAVGTYEAKLTVYNYACSNDPCTLQRCGTPCLTGSDSATIQVRDLTLVPPIADAGPAIITAAPGAEVTFDLTGTTDPDGTIVLMSMDFGDGQKINTPPVKQLSHAYAGNGEYTAKLAVYDDDMQMTPATVSVHVAPPEILPAAPGGLAATSRTSSSIILKWTDNSGNEQGFYIESSPDVTTPVWTRIAQTGANTTTYRVSGLSKRTTYLFRVLSYNGAGASASNIVKMSTSR